VKNDKNHHSSKDQKAAGIFDKTQNHPHTHTKTEGKLRQKKKKHGTQQLTRVGPSRKPSQRTTIHRKTTIAKLLQQESSNQAIKQANA
jgi:hypothetical protein